MVGKGNSTLNISIVRGLISSLAPAEHAAAARGHAASNADAGAVRRLQGTVCLHHIGVGLLQIHHHEGAAQKEVG